MGSKTETPFPLVNCLHCQYCSSFYNDPRISSCLHSFCLECLTRLQEEQDIANNSFIICPICRHNTHLPIEGDVTSLPVNLHLAFEVKQNKVINKVLSSPPEVCEACEEEDSPSVAYCNDCDDLLCDDCWKVHKKQKLTRSHSTFCLDELKKTPRGELVKMVGPSIESIPNCQHHDNQKLSFYCQTDGCCVPVCVECTVDRHDKTKGHEVKEVKGHEEVDQIITDLRESSDGLKENKEKLEIVLQQIDENRHEVQVRKDDVDGCIRNELDELHKIIDNRGRKLFAKNAEIADSKCQRLSTQYDGIQRLAQCIDSCISMTNTATDEYSNVQLLAIANTLLNRANDLQQQYTDTHLDLVDTPNIDVTIDTAKIKELIESCGSVSDPNGAQCYAVLPRQRLGLHTPMCVNVVTRDSTGKLINAETKIEAKLLCDGKIINKALEVTRVKDGSYNVIVISKEVSQQQLSITVNDQHIRGSPFDLIIVPRRDFEYFNKPFREITHINKPRSIAFASNGDMFVTSDGDHCIHVCDKDGVEKTTIGSGKGNGPTQFDSPYGIDIHGNVIYVAEYGNHRIQRLSTDGVFIGTFGKYGSALGQLNGPHDVKVNPSDGKIYVADTNNDRVQVFNHDSSVSHVMDGKVKGDSYFSRPMGIAFDLSGNVCVSAYGSNSVSLFNTKGDLICFFCIVKAPTGIVVDASGYYLVYSCDNSKLSVFHSSGSSSIWEVKVKCSGYGIAVSLQDESVWLADSWKNKLLKYQQF